ncbi:unnamed protein product, partial [Allacma fusca]
LCILLLPKICPHCWKRYENSVR